METLAHMYGTTLAVAGLGIVAFGAVCYVAVSNMVEEWKAKKAWQKELKERTI